MSLFESTSNLRELYSSSLRSWSSILPYETLERLQTTIDFVKKDAENHVVFPSVSNVFRIYNDCPLKEIKVVILGQDPYHDGNAMGYAFGCQIKPSPSLLQILGAMKETVPNTGIKKDIGLEYLVKQGVFLLNTVLTVRAGSPYSHEKIGWQWFTRDTMRVISAKCPHVVWMLWGQKARQQEYAIANENHLILEDSHPVSASYENAQWHTDNFVKANEYLESNGLTKIDWL